jgi:hypothetical protein
MLSQGPRRTFVWSLVAIGLGVIMALGVILVRGASSTIGSFGQPNAPRISHDVVVERLREVAKLVATEMTLRDVVVYEQTRLRSTKRVLLVVTARVSAGINLNATKVELDSAARKITITLPPAQITSVDVTNVTTYDESAGLWNPFTSDDRDEIQRRVRAQMRESAARSGILEHADQAAAKALRDFLSLGGYTVDIRRPLELKQPGG